MQPKIAMAEIINLVNSIIIDKGTVISQEIYSDENLKCSIYGFYKDECLTYERSGANKLYIGLKGKTRVRKALSETSVEYELAPFEAAFIERDVLREVYGSGDYVLMILDIKMGDFMLKNIDKEKKLNLAQELDYQENKIVTKTIANDEKLVMTLLALDAKQELATHSAPGDALVIVLDGKARINIGGTDYDVQTGDSIVMPKDIAHSVHATDKYKMLLIVSK